jgi:hypothetical protein
MAKEHSLRKQSTNYLKPQRDQKSETDERYKNDDIRSQFICMMFCLLLNCDSVRDISNDLNSTDGKSIFFQNIKQLPQTEGLYRLFTKYLEIQI